MIKKIQTKLANIAENDTVRIKDLDGKIEMTTYEQPIYDISQHNIKGRKTKKSKYPYRSLASIKKSLAELRDLIECNFGKSENEFFITFTYSEKKTSITRAYLDAGKFFDCLENETGLKIQYVCKYEWSEKNGWHMHSLVKLLDCDMYSTTEEHITKIVKIIWNYSENVNVQKIKGIAGLMQYLGVIKKPTKAYENYKNELLQGITKENNRWKLYEKYEHSLQYPTGCALYTCSQGLLRAVKKDVTKKEHDEIVAGKKKVYAKSENFVDDETGEIVNTRTKIIHH